MDGDDHIICKLFVLFDNDDYDEGGDEEEEMD